MAEKIFTALVLCTGNSARSVLGEAILKRLGAGRIRAFSAGSQPTGRVNPFAIEILESLGYDTQDARSKSWDKFAGPDAPVVDFVFTVCDSAARESCPVWPGAPVTAHWGLPDPAAVDGSDDDKRAAFTEAYGILEQRIRAFLALPFETMKGVDLMTRLEAISGVGRRDD